MIDIRFKLTDEHAAMLDAIRGTMAPSECARSLVEALLEDDAVEHGTIGSLN